MNIKDKVVEISKLLDELDEYADTLTLEHDDNKIIDLLHLIELNKLNTNLCYRVIKEIRNLRINRRRTKDELELLRTYRNEQDRLLNKQNRQFLLADICKLDKIQKSRKYTYRAYTEDEINELLGGNKND